MRLEILFVFLCCAGYAYGTQSFYNSRPYYGRRSLDYGGRGRYLSGGKWLPSPYPCKGKWCGYRRNGYGNNYYTGRSRYYDNDYYGNGRYYDNGDYYGNGDYFGNYGDLRENMGEYGNRFEGFGNYGDRSFSMGRSYYGRGFHGNYNNRPIYRGYYNLGNYRRYGRRHYKPYYPKKYY